MSVGESPLWATTELLDLTLGKSALLRRCRIVKWRRVRTWPSDSSGSKFPSPPGNFRARSRSISRSMINRGPSCGICLSIAPIRLARNHPRSTSVGRKMPARICGLKNLTIFGSRLDQPDGVLENLAELTNLSRPHRPLFRRRGKIIVETFFQIPLQELHALFHADLFGTAPPGFV